MLIWKFKQILFSLDWCARHCRLFLMTVVFYSQVWMPTETILWKQAAKVLCNIRCHLIISVSSNTQTNSLCSASVTSSSAWSSKTLRPWTPASLKESRHLGKNRRYLKLHDWAGCKCTVSTNQRQWPIPSSLQIEIGLLVGNSQVIFEKAESSSLTLVGRF